MVIAGGVAFLFGLPAHGAPEGVAIAIVYDTSGSMQQKVRDTNGQMTAKSVIASRALNAVLDRLQAAVSGPESTRPELHAGLVVFEGNHGVVAIPCGPFQPQKFRDWVREHGQPKRGTPLGDAVRVAGEAVLHSPLSRKHVVVITDGVNTQGPDPVLTVPKVQREAEARHTPVSLHFVAFDVSAAEFNGVKKLGATVIGAADARELTSALDYIVTKKILLEDEEPPKTK
jgi:Mg-chelatase subunit ChlD